MFFKANTSSLDILRWFQTQLSIVNSIAKNGIDVEVKPHKQIRSNEQNRFLMVVLRELVHFYHETGYMPPECKKWHMRVDILKEYWKDRFGIEHTSKLSTKEFTDFIDGIQRELVEDTCGEWEILTTDSAYLKGLLES